MLVFGGECLSQPRRQRIFVQFEEELFENDEIWDYRESNFRYNRSFAEAQVVEGISFSKLLDADMAEKFF